MTAECYIFVTFTNGTRNLKICATLNKNSFFNKHLSEFQFKYLTKKRGGYDSKLQLKSVTVIHRAS